MATTIHSITTRSSDLAIVPGIVRTGTVHTIIITLDTTAVMAIRTMAVIMEGIMAAAMLGRCAGRIVTSLAAALSGVAV